MISPQKAAVRAGVSRRTIMVAIEHGKLRATRNNRNNWQVDEDSLRDWIAGRTTDTSPEPGTPSETYSDTYHTLAITIARLEEKLKASSQREADLEALLNFEREAHRLRIEELRNEHQNQLDTKTEDHKETISILKSYQRRRFWEWIEKLWASRKSNSK